MLKVDKRQLQMLDDALESAYARELARYMRAEHEAAVAGLSDEELLRRVTIGIAKARGYGITWDSSITGFVAIMFEVAPTFDEQPAIQKVLTDRSVPPDVRVDALWKRTTEEDWVEAERLAEGAERFWLQDGAAGAATSVRQ